MDSHLPSEKLSRDLVGTRLVSRARLREAAGKSVADEQPDGRRPVWPIPTRVVHTREGGKEAQLLFAADVATLFAVATAPTQPTARRRSAHHLPLSGNGPKPRIRR